jgi:hypothetical protein
VAIDIMKPMTNPHLATGSIWQLHLRWAGDRPAVRSAEIEADNHLAIDPDPGLCRIRAPHLKDHDNWMILVQLQQAHQIRGK